MCRTQEGMEALKDSATQLRTTVRVATASAAASRMGDRAAMSPRVCVSLLMPESCASRC
jgi:hypothetical protein